MSAKDRRSCAERKHEKGQSCPRRRSGMALSRGARAEPEENSGSVAIPLRAIQTPPPKHPQRPDRSLRYRAQCPLRTGAGQRPRKATSARGLWRSLGGAGGSSATVRAAYPVSGRKAWHSVKGSAAFVWQALAASSPATADPVRSLRLGARTRSSSTLRASGHHTRHLPITPETSRPRTLSDIDPDPPVSSTRA